MNRLGEDITIYITDKELSSHDNFIKSSRKRQKTQWENCQKRTGKLERYTNNKCTYKEICKFKN